MNADEKNRVRALRRALDTGHPVDCLACWHAGPGRICDDHAATGLRAIARIREAMGWHPDDKPTLTAVPDQ